MSIFEPKPINLDFEFFLQLSEADKAKLLLMNPNSLSIKYLGHFVNVDNIIEMIKWEEII